MSLQKYKQKRDFHRTPEPSGGSAKSNGKRRSAKKLQFVIQKHDASRLHYDFRLELDGVLKSWAVPKGPSLDPAVKALAVHVEDHPLDYAGFEGVIPKGQYGGGTVMVWDRGTWEPEEDAHRGYRTGRLKFRLEGEKLQGSWALVRMGGRAGEDGKNWLLIKHNDEAAKPTAKFDVVKREPRSVISDRDLEAIAADADRVWNSNRNGDANGSGKKGPSKRSPARTIKSAVKRTPARKAQKSVKPTKAAKPMSASELSKLTGARKSRQPARFQPQLATLASAVPQGDRWVHELKFDGYRILAFVSNGRVKLISRNGKDWTHRFPALADAVGKLPLKQGILDGEVVALNDEGLSQFQLLQNAMKGGDDAHLVYYLFDVPHLEGFNLTGTALLERKSALRRLLESRGASDDGPLRYSDHIEGDGETVIEQACQRNMEGILCKRADAPYETARSQNWLKVKCTKRQEFVIAGYTKPSGSRVGLGALLLGYYEGGELRYAGRVGTGFTDESLRQLVKELKSRRTDEPPFSKPLTTAQRRGVTWVKPELVGEVAYTEWTDDGVLRHPSFQGLREDKRPTAISREEAMPVSKIQKSSSTAAPRGKSASENAVVAGVTLSHPDRVLYPELGLTKQELARYYEQIADWILPHIVDRPLTMVRCPGGRSAQCFYQKHLKDSLPDVLRGVMIQEKDSMDEYVVVDDLAGLIALVQIGVLELHPWPARSDNIEAPDFLVFDLDPGEGVTWPQIVEGAREVRDVLGELGLTSFLRTSGGKGLHIVAPVARRISWEDFKEFARLVAVSMVEKAPDRYIATMSKAKRRGKLFVDYLRNQRGATAVASYSTRAREGAPVAAPLAWEELSTRIKPNGFTVANMPRRLAKLKRDPWEDFFAVRQSITKATLAKLARA